MKRTIALDMGGTNFSVAIFEDSILMQVETRLIRMFIPPSGDSERS